VANATAENSPEIEATLQPGEVLDGKYRVDGLIGRGGMATVWSGTNERTGKRVALKLLLPSLATVPAAETLFKREGLAASRIDHPNVVTIFDVIEHRGTACIVMELLTGEPLERHLARSGTLSVNEAYGMLLPAMRGVCAAHAQGVIHRDLKPQNIFICVGPDGRPVTTKVLDFGISLIIERALDVSTGPAPGMPMGTPAYMAPEQISASETIDQRVDVYGFGVLFYEAFSGRVPFPGEPGPALYDRILNEPAAPLALSRPDLPPGIAHAIDVALAKDPTARHRNLAAMVGALEDEILPATPPPRLLTPAAGAPITVSTELARVSRITPATGSSLLSAAVRNPTKLLVNFPLASEASGQRTSRRYEGGIAGEGELDTAVVQVWGWAGKLRRIRRVAVDRASAFVRRLPRRARLGLLATGVAVLGGGVTLLGLAIAGAGKAPAPPAAVRPLPVVVPMTLLPPPPAPAPVAPAEAVSEPSLPPAVEMVEDVGPADEAKPAKRRARARVLGAAVRVARSAARESSSGGVRQVARAPAGGRPGAPASTLAPARGSDAKHRAGTLSAEEF